MMNTMDIKELVLSAAAVVVMIACSPREDKPGNNSDMNNKSTPGVEYDSDSTVKMLNNDTSTRYYPAGGTDTLDKRQ